jgi:hypothetical protein
MKGPIAVVCPDCGVTRQLWPFEVKKQKGPWCKHCGNSRRSKVQMTTHGGCAHPLYGTWKNIQRRISDRRFKAHFGLDMDPAWKDVWVFIKWAEANGWKPDLSIERKDNSRGYWPDNCCFIPFGDQARHTSRNRITWEIAEEVKTLVAAGEIKFRAAKVISAKYNIPIRTVSAVAYGENWK